MAARSKRAGSPAEQRHHGQDARPAQHLEARRNERLIGKRGPMAGIEGAGRPRDRRDEQRRETERIEGARLADDRRADQDPHPDEPDDDADDRDTGQAFAEEQATEDRDPDRHQRDDQGGNSRWDRLLTPRDHAHPAAKEQRAHDRAVAPLAQAGHRERAARPHDRPGQEHEPCEGEAGRRHEERRDRLDRHGDAEVGRSPDDVEDEQAEPEPAAARGTGVTGWHSRLVQVEIIHRRGRGEVALGHSRRSAPGQAGAAMAMVAAPDAGRHTLHGR